MPAPSSHPARAAVHRAARRASPLDPLAGAHVRILGDAASARALFAHWMTRAPGSPRGEMRYRWELSHRRGVPFPDFAPNAAAFRAWRPAEEPLLQKDPFELEERLLLPIVLSENTELLATEAARGDRDAEALLAEALPALRRDFAGFVQALDPWRDMLALCCLGRRPRALALLHPLAVAVATCYAAVSEGGPVKGLRYPFHDKPLVSASAGLAAGLMTLGLELEHAATLVRFVRDARADDGGFADGGGPVDVLTTLTAAELLLAVDPSFDPAPTARALERLRGGRDFWQCLGPDALWLSAEVVSLLESATTPFARRFRWPFVPAANLDRKTRLPFFAYFVEVAHSFAALEGLARAPIEIGFIDLIGFRAFNNENGQERGDDVLAAFARALEALPGVRAIRDGGDEFIVLGAPEGRGLPETLDAFRRSWPGEFAREFGGATKLVTPRILTAATQAGRLLTAREALGRGIGALKGVASDDTGIAKHLGEI